MAAVGLLATFLLVAGLGLEKWQFLLICGVLTAPALRPPWPVMRFRRPEFPLPAVVGVVLVVGFLALLAVDAAHQPLWAPDSWSDWTAKAKAIVLLGGLDPSYMRGSVSGNYPLLVSSLEAIDFRFIGIDTVAIHLQFWCLAAGLIAALADVLRDRVRPLVLWCVLPVLAAAPAFGVQTASGLADVPLACFVAMAGVCALLWLRSGSTPDLTLTALFCAAAVATKTEGALYAGAIGLVVIALRRSRAAVVAAVTVVASALPWTAWSVTHDLGNWSSGRGADIGAPAARAHVSRAFVAAPHLVKEIVDPTSWLLLVPLALAAAALAWRAGLRHEALLAVLPRPSCSPASSGSTGTRRSTSTCTWPTRRGV